MKTYFYTLDLCEDCAYRLELLARCSGFDDVETFAEVALGRGITALEEDLRKVAADAVERRASKSRETSKFSCDLDDDIPF